MKLGRPSKPEKERRSKVITFRVTEWEEDELYKGAVKRGQTIGDFILRNLGFRIDEKPNVFPLAIDSATLRGSR